MDAKARLEHDIGKITEACLELNSTIVALILYGGYGRGEGSWYTDNEENWHPYNDYDVLLVVTEKSEPGALRDTRVSLAKKIGVRWVDIAETNCRNLSRYKPDIYHFELKSGGKVIYGDANILDMMPEIRPSEISLRDAERLFFTRAWTFLGGLKPGGLDVSYDGDESRFFRNQMAKAILAVVDALLLRKKTFFAAYRERVDHLVRDSNHSAIRQSAMWALDEKLHPRSTAMSVAEVRSLFASTRKLYLTHMFCVLGEHYGRKVASCRELETAIFRSVHGLPRRMVSCLYRRSLTPLRWLSIALAQLYLLEANDGFGIHNDSLERGIRLMRKLDHAVPADIDWDRARLSAAKMRMEV
jgi:hypothetical protein